MFFIRDLKGKQLGVSFLFVCILLVLFAIKLLNPDAIHLNGEINSKFNAQLRKVKDGDRIEVSSLGGDPDYAEVAAKIIQSKELKFEVRGLCLSSCVEYLLPAASEIKLSKNSILGVHQNPLMIDGFKDSDISYIDKSLCHFEDNLLNYISLQKNKNEIHDIDHAISEILSKLKLETFSLSEKESCIEVSFKFENQLWFPNSEQLRYVLGLDFTGEACADDFEYCSRRIESTFPPEYSVIIGHETFTTGLEFPN